MARGPKGLNQKPKYVIHQGLARGDMPENQQRAWLERSAEWSDMVANPYVAKKVLGAGSHGLVGVWEYKGDPPQQIPKLIAVKQVSDIAAGNSNHTEPLRVESVVMGWINATNTEHVVKLYKMYFETGGSGAHGIKDGLPVLTPAGAIHSSWKVARIYMEYCRGGAISSQLSAVVKQNDIIPEEYIWRFLHCMASALVVLRHGNENSTHAGPTWATPIAHFDIKPDNSEFVSSNMVLRLFPKQPKAANSRQYW
jgi:serine/threonine protein kinase